MTNLNPAKPSGNPCKKLDKTTQRKASPYNSYANPSNTNHLNADDLELMP